ncbi:conserved protein of unknown function [Candidatus Promineifilum breve]|uniref:BrnT family toxin n=1 Tax=Candidatus Promineifilum breve TaxID=1806508 RepID=A0A160T2J6_9CHLR|nr:BrnT family toxin [Candidatus Promineifilum breve]CUS03822.2 conserved protein of unknown function [Candidatus Promineifilum breve]
MALRFEWDEAKAAFNLAKHGVDFVEAQTVFGDSQSITIFDEHHSDEEDRFIDIGLSLFGRLLVVVYTERDDHIRIISCRPALLSEQAAYERHDT